MTLPNLTAQKKNSSRRNAWGNLSYADLITQAINSAVDNRLTLSQIYEWMVQNVPYFKDKGDSNSSAGWKVSMKNILTNHLLTLVGSPSPLHLTIKIERTIATSLYMWQVARMWSWNIYLKSIYSICNKPCLWFVETVFRFNLFLQREFNYVNINSTPDTIFFISFFLNRMSFSLKKGTVRFRVCQCVCQKIA